MTAFKEGGSEDLIKEANEILSNGKLKEHKAKKVEKQQTKKKKLESAMVRKLRFMEIDPETKAVKIKFQYVSTESEEGEIEKDEYEIKSKRRPHKDLIVLFKRLLKHALAIVEISDSNEDSYAVKGLKIDGDMAMRQSRVTMALSHHVDRTGKNIKIPGCQTTMYGESDYADASKLSKLIEEIEIEAFEYVMGKMEIPGFGPLFDR